MYLDQTLIRQIDTAKVSSQKVMSPVVSSQLLYFGHSWSCLEFWTSKRSHLCNQPPRSAQLCIPPVPTVLLSFNRQHSEISVCLEDNREDYYARV